MVVASLFFAIHPGPSDSNTDVFWKRQSRTGLGVPDIFVTNFKRNLQNVEKGYVIMNKTEMKLNTVVMMNVGYIGCSRHSKTRMMINKKLFLYLLAVVLVAPKAAAYNIPGAGSSTRSDYSKPSSSRSKPSPNPYAGAKLTPPNFNKATGKYEKNPKDDGEYPYDAVGALLRHGPVPFVTRVVNPAGYEQDILSYMAEFRASRAEATGNLDFKLNNAADWGYYKMEEQRTGRVADLTALNKKRAILAIIWAVGVMPTAVYVVAKTVEQITSH